MRVQERSCYVAFNPAKEEQIELDRNSDQNNYVLPDGRQVKVRGLWLAVPCRVSNDQIGASRFRAPEVLFSPDLIGEECEGVHEVLANSILRADMDLRKTLYANIVLSGGSTLFKGGWCTCHGTACVMPAQDSAIVFSAKSRRRPRTSRSRLEPCSQWLLNPWTHASQISAPQERTMTTWIGYVA